MSTRTHRFVLMFAVIISLILHAVILVPSIVAAAMADPSYTDLDEVMENEHADQEEEPERLGLDESDVSTMTWIGYDTYREHLAQLSEFDQAQFIDASSPVSATTQGEQQGQPTQAGATPTPPAKPATKDGGGGVIEGHGEGAGGQPSHGAGPLSTQQPGAAVKPSEVPSEKPEDAEAPPKPQPKPTPETPPGDAPQSGGGAPPTPPSDEPTPPEPNASKKESDATSTISVPRDKWLSGRPLASQGLELIPKRPDLTSLQNLSGIPNMLVVIRFGANGKPKEATMLNSSGNIGIDVAVKASLYRWRARGKRLQGLSETGTIDVRLELISRRRH